MRSRMMRDNGKDLRMRANSDIGLLIPEVHLFRSRKKCKRFLKRRGIRTKLYDTEGQMIYHDGLAVVLMEHSGRPSTEQALLVHEAYHAAVAHMEWLGEDDYGEESMAYLLQTISAGLFEAYFTWKNAKN